MGIDYTKRPKAQPPQQPPPAPQGGYPPAPPAQPSYQQPPQPDYQRPPAAAPVNLAKVTLTKSAPGVSLTKQGAATGQVRVNLNWTSGAKADCSAGQTEST